jgi:hypothetical protein
MTGREGEAEADGGLLRGVDRQDRGAGARTAPTALREGDQDGKRAGSRNGCGDCFPPAATPPCASRRAAAWRPLHRETKQPPLAVLRSAPATSLRFAVQDRSARRKGIAAKAAMSAAANSGALP